MQRGIAAATGLEAELKWPNDVMIGRRKLAGVLAEACASASPARPSWSAPGSTSTPRLTRPTLTRGRSDRAELGRPDRELVLAAVLEALGGALASLERDAAGGILDEWRALAPSAVGTRVEWQDANRPRAGITAGIDETGALLVRTTAGVERVIAGELQWALRG